MLVCSDPPKGTGHWTLRLLADRLIELGYVDYINPVAVGELLKKQTASLMDWQFTTADARIKLKRLYPVVKEQNVG